MSIIHVDDFQSYGTNTGLMLQGVYASHGDGHSSLVPDPSGTGETVLFTGFGGTNGGNPGWRWVLPSNQGVVGFAARVWQDQLQDVGNLGLNFVTFLDTTGAQLGRVYFDPTGRILAQFAGITYTSVSPVVTAAGFYHIEAKVVASVTGNGELHVFVEGIEVLTETGLTFTSATVGMLTFGDYYNNLNLPPWGWYWKDLVVWDGAGTVNNDVLGTVLVESLDLTSDVALNWTPNVGTTGYTILNNNPPNDAQYLSAGFSPIPAPYVATMSPVPDDTTTVRALVTRVRAAKVDGGDGFLQTGLQSDSTHTGTYAVALGANRPITTAQTYWTDVFEFDPKTSAPWTPAAADQARFQFNRTV